MSNELKVKICFIALAGTLFVIISSLIALFQIEPEFFKGVCILSITWLLGFTVGKLWESFIKNW